MGEGIQYVMVDKSKDTNRLLRVKLPFIIWLIMILTIPVLIGDFTVFGYQITGWGWFIPFVLSILILLNRLTAIKFPVLIWMPWILVVSIYPLFSQYPSLQRSVQLLCPLVIAMAVSTYRYDEMQIEKFFQIGKYLAIGLVVIVAFKTGIILTGTLPEITGLAPQVMTGMLLCSLFAVRYAYGWKSDIRWWSLLFAIPIVGITRTAIVATGLTLPLTLGPLKMQKRIMILIGIILLGIVIFYTPRVQHKMFYKGTGEMSDVLSEDFRNTGRYYMWDNMTDEIKKEPWVGHGTGAGERFVRRLTNNTSGYPHNDWLLTMYDYGILGTGVYAITLIAASLHAFHTSRDVSMQQKILFLTAASSFIPYMLLMITDNIMVYASFFGNIQFTILGIAYGALHGHESHKRQIIRIKW
jgi:hypothetical protein